MNIKAMCAFAPTLFLLACTAPTSQNSVTAKTGTASIIGGNAASEKDAVTASTVFLMMSNADGNGWSCTGTVISSNLVLTAAHCIVGDGSGTQKISAYLGSKKPTNQKDPGILAVSAWVAHPDYETVNDFEGQYFTGRNDVALVKLESALPASAKALPLLERSSSAQAGDRLLLAGYGIVQEIGDVQGATGLNYVTVSVERLVDSIIVTNQTNAQGACAGDSGGPGFLETGKGLVVAGITRGPHHNVEDCRHFGEYTNASHYKAFILEQAREMEAEAPNFVGRNGN